jgi:hypothetical protein
MPSSPSEEQDTIIQNIKNGYNVITDSVAGSGKTTTILFLAKSELKKRIVVVTYNSRLKAETRQRVIKENLTNIEVHSYHSLGLAYYSKPCMSDIHLRNIVKQDKENFMQIRSDILIIDEAQDMTKTYYDFITKVIRDIKNPNLQLFVMGDNKQCIYDYLGADARFLTFADQIYPTNKEWKKCYLHTSYRITKNMERFVNDIVLGYPRMKSVRKSTIPVKYIVGDPFNKLPKYLSNEIRMMLLCGIKPGEIFVLAPSVRSTNEWNPVKRLENTLVRMGIPCFVPLSDDEELNDEVIEGKVVFSTFHKSKGLERRIIIVFNFSTSFYYVFKDAPREVCPNVAYVGITRACERLYLCGESEREQPLPFLNHSLLKNSPYLEKVFLDSTGKNENGINSPKENDKMDLKIVTNLTRFLPEESIAIILELCKVKVLQAAQQKKHIKGIISTSHNRVENVSDLNGIAIPTVFEHRKKGFISIQTDLETHFVQSIKGGEKLSDEIKEWIAIIQKEPKTPEDYLKLANIFSAYTSGYIYKIAQIKEYTWLDQNDIDSLVSVLESSVKGNPETMMFEESLEYLGYEFNNRQIHLAGRADLIDDEILWEIKCVDTIRDEHIIQLALYAWLWQKTFAPTKGKRRFCLINLLTSEIQEITGIENLTYIIDICLDNAYRIKKEMTDEEFVQMCAKGPDTSSGSEMMSSSAPKVCLIDDDDDN